MSTPEYRAEKISNIIRGLQEIRHYIEGRNSLDESMPWDKSEKLRDAIENKMAEVFYDLTKLLADAYEVPEKWSTKDRVQLMELRDAGLGILITKYSRPPQ